MLGWEEHVLQCALFQPTFSSRVYVWYFSREVYMHLEGTSSVAFVVSSCFVSEMTSVADVTEPYQERDNQVVTNHTHSEQGEDAHRQTMIT